MPKVSKDGATQGGDHGPVVDRSEELGGYTVNFLTFRQDIDHTPILKGLPDDSCQCPHWGYVLKGRWTVLQGDREETFEAGDAFYMAPGHVPLSNEPGLQVLMFSPTEELRKTEEVLMKNVQAMQAQAN